MIEEGESLPDQRARRALLGVLARAFRDNPMNVRIHGPNPARRVRANRAGLRALVLDSARDTLCEVLSGDGRIVGGLVAARPGHFPLPSPRLRRQLACLFEQGARAMDAWGRVNLDLGPFRPIHPHWYLAVLGVEPELHGKGLGGELLSRLIDRAESSGHPIYLESDRPASVDFYRSRGFEILHQDRVHEVDCWCMGRGIRGESFDLCDSVRQGH